MEDLVTGNNTNRDKDLMAFTENPLKHNSNNDP